MSPKPTKKATKSPAKPERYNPSEFEPRWQEKWLKAGANATPSKAGRTKKYVLDMFPYPSGDGLHIGHVESYTASDIMSRWYRMQGYDVLHPMGWDAFGLPAENYAIKTGIHPRITTKKNTDTFRRQMQRMGFSYDWSREVNTTDPEYYKWTQWIFLKLFQRGLAYEAEVAINWCPSCKTGLANEEVVDGECDRCGSIVGKKNLRQWLLKITDYAEPLLRELDGLDWPERIKEMQRNWIGRSEGAEISFALADDTPAAGSVPTGRSLTVYTTRPDTLFGCTYLVVAPEHELARELATDDRKQEVEAYIETSLGKTDRERQIAKKKTGVFTGTNVVNPANGQKVPVWVADYVLGGYGTGAVMAVPAHDERDWEFAKAYKLPIVTVIEPDAAGSPTKDGMDGKSDAAYVGEGRMVSSGEFTNLASDQARTKITEWLTQRKRGKSAVHYKLRDWVFSRQRYWGEPIPIIHCPDHGAVAVPEKDLPVRLPEVEKFQPTGTGESPLADVAEWVNTACPTCDKPARRETNTMPQWAGSSWYFLRFADPHNKKEAWSPAAIKAWLPVDLYVGGAEHAVLHLLYSRFWIKALNDTKLLPFREPFMSLRNQGIILAEDGRKMSKSLGNVVNPDDVVKVHGADSLRLFEMFLGPLEQEKAWSTKGIAGLDRFLDRVWRLQFVKHTSGKPSSELNISLNRVTKKVTEDLGELHFNTAISALMECSRELSELQELPTVAYEQFLLLLAPLAPHITEELWQRLGHKDSIHEHAWPTFDESVLTQTSVEVVIQVNGKFRGSVSVPIGSAEAAVSKVGEALPAVVRALNGKPVKKRIFVVDRALNLLT